MDDEYWVPNPDDEDEIMREYEQHNQGDNLDHIDFSEFENSAILNEINCSSNNVRSEISQSLSQYVDEQHSECSGKPSQLNDLQPSSSICPNERFESLINATTLKTSPSTSISDSKLKKKDQDYIDAANEIKISKFNEKRSSISTLLADSQRLVTQNESSHHDNDSEDKLHTLPPRDTIYSTCTLLNGCRKYIKKSDGVANSNYSIITSDSQMLSKPISQLLEDAISIQIQHQYIKNNNSQQTSNMDVSFEYQIQRNQSQSELWVEKYRPTTFSHLLSPENINREVLRSLKQWDPFVFKKAKPVVISKSAIYPTHQKRSNYKDYKGKMKLSTRPNSKEVDPTPDNELKDDLDKASGDDSAVSGLRELLNAADSVSNRDSRPEMRVILLSGPPGTGKTTLAHILSTHCGYRPFEINASDDRTLDVLKESITSAMTANTIYGDKKPNCIILDEIDGIDNTAAIDMIVSLATAPLKSTGNSLSGDFTGSNDAPIDSLNSLVSMSARNAVKKKRGKGRIPHSAALTRPLICICNDHYAPVLKSLKKIAKIFILTPPTEQRLLQRLKTICLSEKMEVPQHVLLDLCCAAGNDFRSCINTLQFAASKISEKFDLTDEAPPKRLKSTQIISETILHMIKNGLKDKQKDVYSIWKEIFSTSEYHNRHKSSSNDIESLSHLKPSIKCSDQSRSNQAPNLTESNIGTLSKYESISYDVLECYDDGLVTSGMHENVLRLKFSDPDFNRTYLSLEWLSYADCIDYFARNVSGGYQVINYTASTAVAIHLLCAQPNKISRLEWPLKDRNEYYRQQQKKNMLHAVVFNPLADLNTRSSIRTSTTVIALDVLSALMDIVTPRVRAIPATALSPYEKDCIVGVVSVMASCGLNYTLSTEVGETNKRALPYATRDTMELVLDPNIRDLITFSAASSIELSVDSSSSLQSKYSKNSHSELKADNALLMSRHPPLHDETCRIINKELKTYLIKLKSESESGTVEGTVAGKSTLTNSDDNRTLETQGNNFNITALSNSTKKPRNMLHSATFAATGNKHDTEHNTSYQDSSSYAAPTDMSHKRAIESQLIEDETEAKIMLKARRGKMDMFCTATPRLNVSKKMTIPGPTSLPGSKGSQSAPAHGASLGIADSTRQHKPTLHFKFNQGFSNAVKRPVCIKEFLS